MSTNVSSRSRDQDGKFAPELRTQASAFQDEVTSHKTSFCFPPRHSAADELVDYFEHAEIPDQVLSNTAFAYVDFREYQVRKQADIWALRWQASPEYQDYKKAIAAEGKGALTLHERGNKLINEKEDEFRNELPMELPPHEVENVARYGQMYLRASNLPESESVKVGEHKFKLTNGREVTVDELVEYYQIDRWLEDAITLSDLQVARTSQRSADRIVAALQKLNRG